MAILTKTAITSILIGDSVDPTIANLPHSELETNIDDLIAYLKASSVGAFEYDSVTSTGLNFDYESGTYQNRNVSYVIASGSRSLSASVTSYIEINTSAGTITHNASGFTAANIPLWEVTTDGSSITGVIDRRTSFGIRNTLGIDDQSTLVQITVDDANSTFSNNVIFSSTSTISGIMTHNARPAFNGGTSGSTSPFTVDSTQVVTSLNADLLDGQHGSYYAPASHNHDASNITTGTLAVTRGGTGVTASTGTGNTVRSITPALTGNPTTPDQAANNNSTRIANTKYVDNAVSGGSNNTTILASGTQSMGSYAYWYPSAGVYNVTADQANLAPTIYISGVWRGYDIVDSANSKFVTGLFCDGTNMRVRNTFAAAYNAFWQRF